MMITTSSVASVAPCTYASHAELKKNIRKFLAATVPAYIERNEWETIEYRHCKRCDSTLATPTAVRS